jgi:hypothetical protein
MEGHTMVCEGLALRLESCNRACTHEWLNVGIAGIPSIAMLG